MDKRYWRTQTDTESTQWWHCCALKNEAKESLSLHHSALISTLSQTRQVAAALLFICVVNSTSRHTQLSQEFENISYDIFLYHSWFSSSTVSPSLSSLFWSIVSLTFYHLIVVLRVTGYQWILPFFGLASWSLLVLHCSAIRLFCLVCQLMSVKQS